ncbi:hypothetical protein NDN08_002413 [Rhodosorus marinus]|uniref:Uncharacterized protein n=1 Tax=Rhodosorus marinus TaxID=101924 RepID=A0AAV8UWH3_9RHOD|nr:hypothetical protein NDN08_002413 [Rhodosorus marinus]
MLCNVESGEEYRRNLEGVNDELCERFGWGGETDKEPVRLYMHVLRKLRQERGEKSARGWKMDAPRNFVIFDWDDTILATTALSDISRATAGHVPSGTQSLATQLADLDRTAVEIFEIAKRMGQAMIVTNSSAGWVEDSSRAFYPKLHKYLLDHNVQIISARDLYSQTCPDAPYRWKSSAFSEVLRGEGGDCLNVTVLGDCYSDQYAAHAVHRSICDQREIVMKFVKFRVRPTVSLLQKELGLLTSSLEKILNCKSSFDVCISSSSAEANGLQATF